MNLEFEQIISTSVRDWIVTEMGRHLWRWKQYWEYSILDLKVPFQRAQQTSQWRAEVYVVNIMLMFAVAQVYQVSLNLAKWKI